MAPESDSEYLTTAQVQKRFGNRSRMWIFRKQRDAGFPAPVRFGEGSRPLYRLSELIEWEQRTGRKDVKGKRPGNIAA
jgi:predicted DNA-binding transcriptional regulator AlpA